MSKRKNLLKGFNALRYCPRCNRPFLVSSNSQRTCSPKCSRELHSKHRKRWYRKNFHKFRMKQVDVNKIRLEQIKSEIGRKCILCNSERKIVYHEIHFKKHGKNYKYILEHMEDFIPLCRGCHNVLHWLRKLKNKKEMIFRLLKGEK